MNLSASNNTEEFSNEEVRELFEVIDRKIKICEMLIQSCIFKLAPLMF